MCPQSADDKLYDRLLGMLAVEKRWISEKQLKQCLNALEFAENSSLASILLSKNYLTSAQIDRLIKEVNPDSSPEPIEPTQEKTKTKVVRNQRRFGDIAIESHFISLSQVERSLQEQSKYLERGVKIPIGQILYRLNFLTLPQLKKLLQSQLSQTLYCKRCKITKVISNYNPNSLYPCEKCGLDLIEVYESKKNEPEPAVDDTDDDDDINNFREIRL